jgi:lipopolysaccharide/colanic/teichoic acid biosynthesis glycosyltransferase
MGEDTVLTMARHATRTKGLAGTLRRDARASLWWKRPLDLVIALSMLLITAPLLAMLALAVRLDSPGPAFYRQERVGKHGRPFRIWKLRTMRTNNDEQAHRDAAVKWFAGQDNGNGFKSLDDPRITRLGRVLRRTSLDELPQLFNVLTGEMSLVGPRPAIAYELNMYQPGDFRRQDVSPGLTGLWQVSGRERLSARRMMELDLEYLERASLQMDLKIILKTAPVVMGGVLGGRRG